MSRSAVFAFSLVFASCALSPVAVPAAETPSLPLRLTAMAVNLSGSGAVGAQRLDIVIERWTTDEERNQLLETLASKNSDALLEKLKEVKPRAGFIRTASSLGWNLQYARENPLPNGGRRIVFATDRPISFYELRNNTRSLEYDFMLGEIRLGADGVGEGKLTTAAKINYDKANRTIEIEDYSTEPVRLTQVRVEK